VQTTAAIEAQIRPQLAERLKRLEPHPIQNLLECFEALIAN
jgi:hypothetical protein